MAGVPAREAAGVKPEGTEEDGRETEPALGGQGEREALVVPAPEVVVQQSEDQRCAQNPGQQRGATAFFHDQVTAKNHFFHDGCHQGVEAKEEGDVGLLLTQTEGDFAPGFRGEEQECSADSD